MLAEIIQRLRDYVHTLPDYERVIEDKFLDADHEIPLVSRVKLSLTGSFKIIKDPFSVSYHGSIIAQETGEGTVCNGEEVDNFEYIGIQKVIAQIKQKIEESVNGTDYQSRGPDWNSSNIWFTLERRLVSKELQAEREEIQMFFPKCTEIYET
jgi:hypothetical protein